MRVSRRTFLKGAGAAVGVAGIGSAEASGADAASPALRDRRAPLAVTLELNGKPATLRVLPETPLAHAVRDLGLTGTKLACEGGACGACTVHVDGAVRAGCLTLAMELEGAAVRTIGGLGSSEGGAPGSGALETRALKTGALQTGPSVPPALAALHPVQRAILEADALQCGFCTPGFAMAGAAFYERFCADGRSGEPSPGEVARALAGNLCRCGCQPALVEAVAAACAARPARAPGGAVLHEERALARVDGVEKVTGRAQYASDVQLPDMLHAAFVRSPVPHGVISRIDAASAMRVPGVVAVDLSPIERKGGYGRLRYVGQPIAVIAAESEARARQGARALRVDIDPLPFVIEEHEAKRAEAPVVWEPQERVGIPEAGELPNGPELLRSWRGNVRGALFFGAGIEGAGLDGGGGPKAVEHSAVVTELRATTGVQLHATLERHGCVAVPEEETLTIHTGCQSVSTVARDLADRLGLPRGKVRVVSEHVGGAFGSKAVTRPEHIAAARLALRTGRPVRLFYDFADHLLYGGHRPSTEHQLRVGTTRGGRLQAVHHEGRSGCGVAVGERATGMTSKHAPWRSATVVDENILTHTAPALAFRAPGFPPNAFVLEQVVDEISAKARRHPLALRLDGEGTSTRARLYRMALSKTRILREAEGDGRFVRGTGIATAHWAVIANPSCAVELRAHRSGHLEVYTAIHDIGQGARTVLFTLIGEELGLSPSRIAVRIGDSALVAGTGASGSRTTTSIAPAVLDACAALKAQLLRVARASHHDAEATPGGVLVKRDQRIPWGALFAGLPADPVVVHGRRGDDARGYRLPRGKLGVFAGLLPGAITFDQLTSVQVADIEVDRLLGRVRVRKVDVFVDAGRVVSPITARTQVVGAVMQGTSRALYEERRMDAPSGAPLSRTFEEYALLGVADAPEVEVHFFEPGRTHNRAGVLGLGENATIATCAAIANGFFRATGRRVLSTPISPRRVLEVLA
jgi:xanthine dehydrogenase YagR molybdenum-binding subunit